MKRLFTLCCAVVVVATVTADAQINLNNGLVAYYPLNGNVNDSTGNGHNGIAFGSLSYTTDQWGNPGHAADFDGINDYVLVPPSQQLTPDSSFSLAFRFRSGSGANQALISKSDWQGTPTTTNYIQYQIGIHAGQFITYDGLFLGTDHNGSCATTTFLASNYSISQDSVKNSVWYCGAVVFDHGVKSVYVDGMLKDRDTVSGQANNLTVDDCNQGDLKFGGWWSLDPQYFKGALDEVRVYDRALNAAEVDSFCKMIIIVPTGVSTLANNGEQLAIYPNPVTDHLTVNAKGAFSAINVYSAVGRLLITTTVVSDQTEVNTSMLPSGTYYLRLTGENGAITRRFVK